MPSRAKLRVFVEQALRAVVVTAITVLLWQSLRQSHNSGAESARTRGAGDLADWSSTPRALSDIHLELDNVPRPDARAWLGALDGAGSRVTWSGSVPSLAIDAQPVASPMGGTKFMVAAPAGFSVVIADDVGVIDTAQTQHGGVTLMLGSVAGQLTTSAGGSIAAAIERDSVALNRILVIGAAGWESKLTTVALEEQGWKVDALIRVAPDVYLTQGSAAAIDTSRYSAVIALDGAASAYANRIVEFARMGGGVVLTSQSASIDALSQLRTGSVGRANVYTRPIQGAGSATLAIAPILSLRSGAVPLEKRAGVVTTAANRIGVGRVVQIGYKDTWRWRMGGGDDAVREHRAWWTGLVGSVAHTPHLARANATASTEEAPIVGLVASIGPAMPVIESSLAGTPSEWRERLFWLMALGLLGEVASRRLRRAV